MPSRSSPSARLARLSRKRVLLAHVTEPSTPKQPMSPENPRRRLAVDTTARMHEHQLAHQRNTLIAHSTREPIIGEQKHVAADEVEQEKLEIPKRARKNLPTIAVHHLHHNEEGAHDS